MPKLFDEIKSLEDALKQKNPKAHLLWREEYYEAIKYAPTPADVQNMSLCDLIVFIGQKKRFFAEQKKIKKELPPKPLCKGEPGASKDAWLVWMYLARELGYEYNLKQIAKMSKWSHFTMRKAHMRYKFEGRDLKETI